MARQHIDRVGRFIATDASVTNSDRVAYDGTVSGLAATTVQDAIDEVVSDLGGATSDVAGLISDLATATSDIAGLISDLATATSDIAGLVSDLATATSDIANISSDLATATSDIALIFSDVRFVAVTDTAAAGGNTVDLSIQLRDWNGNDIAESAYVGMHVFANGSSNFNIGVFDNGAGTALSTNSVSGLPFYAYTSDTNGLIQARTYYIGGALSTTRVDLIISPMSVSTTSTRFLGAPVFVRYNINP